MPMVLCVAILSAQQARAVRGTVKDQRGHVLAGAVFQIQNMESFNIRSYITQKAGDYYFRDPDATPSHSYLKMLYRYPQCEFRYALLGAQNA